MLLCQNLPSHKLVTLLVWRMLIVQVVQTLRLIANYLTFVIILYNWVVISTKKLKGLAQIFNLSFKYFEKLKYFGKWIYTECVRYGQIIEFRCLDATGFSALKFHDIYWKVLYDIFILCDSEFCDFKLLFVKCSRCLMVYHGSW